MPPRGVDLADMVARFGHQLHNLNDRFVLGDLTREEYLSQSRALKASLEVGRPQTTHGDDVLARATERCPAGTVESMRWPTVGSGLQRDTVAELAEIETREAPGAAI